MLERASFCFVYLDEDQKKYTIRVHYKIIEHIQICLNEQKISTYQ